jgi:FeS assembly SUF system protein
MPDPDQLEQAEQFLSADESAGSSDESAGPPAADLTALAERITAALKTVYDPEIPVDIFELGLIYKIDVDDDRHVHIDMTLTSPACPVAGILPDEVKEKVETLHGVAGATVEVVWDPPWNPSMMSEEAQLELGMF